MTQHIFFEAAGLKLAIRADLVRAIHDQLPVRRVAGTCHWFLGLAVADGRLLPVTDIGAFSGGQRCTGDTLELAAQVAVAGLRIDEVTGMGDSNALEILHDRSGADGFEQQITLTGESLINNGSLHHVLDVSALVESAAFVNIREIEA